MLYESISYDHETDKRTVFEFMKEMIDQIYGVESQIVERAMERFAIGSTAPKNFDIITKMNKSPLRKELLQKKIGKMQTDTMKSKNLST